ncbi:DUF3084 domain-containing protein [Aphanothece hegewaldii CCALA 016]|uniref:DUF3084 domain-containing protein n=1 Tax=Aphanothece hegewaldii CCALA 016 TaxID=2107694 RepID=A0A2T1LY13_9CHRO|nr:DUF3084 domain-containing protein [Aphanothece hegewaldii]PSF37280.1 DUF3084 domain-containing protein [Aphanothece hegewaldii CCALA 016]
MTSAYILIASILILGGVLAALGDRLGSKIGKKRMRIFNLRPRQTATVMTIATGIVIASSTLGLLFGLSKSLRQGVFELDQILSERRAAIRQLESELKKARLDKAQIQKELEAAKTEQSLAKKRLVNINRNFQSSQTQLKTVTLQLSTVQSDVATLVKERQQLQQQKTQLTSQKEQLATQKNQLSTQLNKLQEQVKTRDQEIIKRQQQLRQQDQLLAQRQNRLQSLEKEQKQLQTAIDLKDDQIGQLDQAIAEKDINLKQREAKLQELELQLSYFRREVEILEQYYQTYQDLRERKIAIVRGQVLAFGALQVVNPGDAQSIVVAVDQILQQANLSALQATQPNNPNSKLPIVKITKAQVEQLVQQLQDGREYVVRILSAGNYVLGEQEIRVFADVAPNQRIFEESQEIAAVSIDSQNMSEEDLQNRLDTLLAASQFRARRAGVLGDIQVEDGRLTSLIGFMEKINQSDDTIDEIKTIAVEKTYTSGPLKLRLVAIKDGEIIFST